LPQRRRAPKSAINDDDTGPIVADKDAAVGEDERECDLRVIGARQPPWIFLHEHGGG
jgi:hypothetical protein